MTLVDDGRGHLRDLRDDPRRQLPGRRTWLAVAAVAGVLLVALAFVIGGGGGGGAARSGGGSAVTAPSNATFAGGSRASSAGGKDGSASAALSPGSPTLPGIPADVADKVVKTGEMDLEVAQGQVPHTLDRLIALATLDRGLVAESHSSDGSVPSGSVTLRVPVQSFDTAVTQVRALPGKVISQQTAASDVTAKYVDLQARIHSLIATRSSFERLLARATTIGDTLAVQSRVTDVQTQIEQLQGQLRVLADQATFGTLTVTVDERAKPSASTHEQSGMSRAWHRSWDRFVNGVEAIVGIIGPLLLVGMVALLFLLVGRLAYRMLRRQQRSSLPE
jgi:hypothetical protein